MHLAHRRRRGAPQRLDSLDLRRGLWFAGAIVAGALTAGFAFVSGCGQGEAPLESIDPDAAPLQPTYTQVAGILGRSCVPCHGGSSAKILNGDEDEADESPDLSTCEGVRDAVDSVWNTIDRGTMPPGAWARLSEAEKLLIQRWKDQGACCGSTCP